MSEKKSKNRVKKEELVAKLSEKAAKSKAVVFTDYQGLTHKQLEELKKAVKLLGAEYVVAKNTLLKLALHQKVSKELKGPTAALFAYEDPIAALAQLAKSFKLLNLPKIKFGTLEGQALSGEDLLKLATSPSKEALIAQFIGSLKSPIFGLHRALNWNLSRLVLTLKVIESKREVSQ